MSRISLSFATLNLNSSPSFPFIPYNKQMANEETKKKNKTIKSTQSKIHKLIIYPEEVLFHTSNPDAECFATMLVQQDSIPLIVHEKGKVKVSEQLYGSEQRGT